MGRGLSASARNREQKIEAGHLPHDQIADQHIRLLPLDCLEGLPAGDSNRRAESLSPHPRPSRRDNLLPRGVVLLALGAAGFCSPFHRFAWTCAGRGRFPTHRASPRPPVLTPAEERFMKTWKTVVVIGVAVTAVAIAAAVAPPVRGQTRVTPKCVRWKCSAAGAASACRSATWRRAIRRPRKPLQPASSSRTSPPRVPPRRPASARATPSWSSTASGFAA